MDEGKRASEPREGDGVTSPAATVGFVEVGGSFVFLMAGGRSGGQLLACWEPHGPVPQTPGSPRGAVDGRGFPSAGAAGGTIRAGRAAVKCCGEYSRLVSVLGPGPGLTAVGLNFFKCFFKTARDSVNKTTLILLLFMDFFFF